MALTSSRVTISSAIALSNPRFCPNASLKPMAASETETPILYNNPIKSPLNRGLKQGFACHLMAMGVEFIQLMQAHLSA
jgi:hypothetical protein